MTSVNCCGPRGMMDTPQKFCKWILDGAYDAGEKILLPAKWAFMGIFENCARKMVFPGAFMNDADDLELDRDVLVEDFKGNIQKIITSDGKLLDGMFFEGAKGSPLVILCTPNACRYEEMGSWIEGYQDMGLNILTFNYRGYGRSQGIPTERGIYLDVEAALKHAKENLLPEIQNTHVFVHGVSLGGAAALHLASVAEGTHAICDQTFSKIAKIAEKCMPKYIHPVINYGFEQDWKFDNVEKARTVKGQVFTINALWDHMMDNTHAEEISKARYRELNAQRHMDLPGPHVTCVFEHEGGPETIEAFIRDTAENFN